MCTAANALGAARLLVTLAVLGSPPRIAGGQPRLLTAHSGTSVALPCKAQGWPPPSISWLLANSTRLSRLSHPSGPGRARVEPDGTLLLRAVTVYDRGLYTCLATNPAGSDALALRLQVVAAPPSILEEKRQSVVGVLGDSLRLPCTAQGNPEPTVHWVLPDGTVLEPVMGSRIHVYPNGSLAIEAVTEKDAGDYLCVARNRIGDDLILMKVSITMKPAKIDHKQQSKKLVPYGKDFRVDCKASGSPTPEISWGLPDGTVVNNAMVADDSGHRARRFVLFDNGTLHLNKAGVAEGGDYTCYAQNTLGRDEMKVHVTVLVAAPRIKHNHKTQVAVAAGDTARLDCEAAAEPRAQIFWLLPSSEMISSSTGRHSLHANGSLAIGRAGLPDAGQYLCVARNPGGDDTKLYRLQVAAKAPIINGVHRNKTIMRVTRRAPDHPQRREPPRRALPLRRPQRGGLHREAAAAGGGPEAQHREPRGAGEGRQRGAPVAALPGPGQPPAQRGVGAAGGPRAGAAAGQREAPAAGQRDPADPGSLCPGRGHLPVQGQQRCRALLGRHPRGGHSPRPPHRGQSPPGPARPARGCGAAALRRAGHPQAGHQLAAARRLRALGSPPGPRLGGRAAAAHGHAAAAEPQPGAVPLHGHQQPGQRHRPEPAARPLGAAERSAAPGAAPQPRPKHRRQAHPQRCCSAGQRDREGETGSGTAGSLCLRGI
uniref:Ig-like domain-containing protein n=1 Tax=Ficedula albicollis TaxID=59894 RepID=U3JRE7_FICAL